MVVGLALASSLSDPSLVLSTDASLPLSIPSAPPAWTTVPPLTEVYEEFLYKLAVFAITLVVGVLIGRLVAVPLAERALKNERVTPTVRRPAIRAIRVGVLFVAFFAALFFARLESLLTVTGGFAAALTLAIGFASRDVLGNLVGGLFIITDPKFNIGDWIEWESAAGNPKEGIIEDISFRATRVRTFRNELITIPNSTLANSTVTNHDIRDRLRIDYPFSVEYGGDIDAMREVLLAEAIANDRILDDPEPTVVMDDLTAAGLGLTARFWISDPSREKYLAVRSAYFQAVKERFEREGMEMSPDYLELTGDLDVSGAPTTVTRATGIDTDTDTGADAAGDSGTD